MEKMIILIPNRHILYLPTSGRLWKDKIRLLFGAMYQYRDYTHASDIAKGILRAMDIYAIADPVNIATGRATSVNELVRKIL